LINYKLELTEIHTSTFDFSLQLIKISLACSTVHFYYMLWTSWQTSPRLS